jgi:NTP pyrophosphatase (non-canonical NTP hydrolase)
MDNAQFNYKEYENMVQALKASNYKEMGKRLSDPVTYDVIHGVIGLVSETVELDEALDQQDDVGVKEELGDMCWYWVLTLNAYGISLEQALTYPVDETAHCGRAAIDIAKRLLAYGQSPEVYREHIVNYGCGFLQSLQEAGDLDAILAANYSKLLDKNKGRYKSGSFSSVEAIERNVEAERELLETSPIASNKDSV